MAVLPRYRAALEKSLKRPLLVLGIGYSVLAASCLLVPFLGSQFFPPAERNQLLVDIELPSSDSRTSMRATVDHAVALIKGHEEVLSAAVFSGGTAPRFYYNVEAKEPANYLGQILINTRHADDVTGLLVKLRQELDKSVPGARCVVKQLEQGPPVKEPIQIRVSGENLDKLRLLADQVAAELRAAGGYHVFDDLGLRMPNIQIDIDQDRANSLGLNNKQIGNVAQASFTGLKVIELREGDRLIPVLIRGRIEDRSEAEKIRGLYVQTPDGKSVPFESFSTLKGRPEFVTIPHYIQLRTVTVKAYAPFGELPSQILDRARPGLAKIKSGNSYVGGFEALWEIDLWGRVRRMNEAVRANFMATQEGRRAVMISVVSGVARAYFELLELDEQLVIAQRTTGSYERTLKLFSDQHAGGLASKLEVSRAELALRTVTATVPEIERQIAIKENEINTLLGRNPGPIARTSTLLAQEMPVEIPVGLPSTLLERRPDVRATEQQVRAANAEIGVAIGDFFPRIGLTTIYGGTSTDLDKLLRSEANIWSAAATAAGPVFTGGRLTGRYRQTKGAFEQARLSYQQTALSAFREVSDALISHSRYEDERVEQSQAVGAGREAVELATVRYQEGKASYYEVLEAQQQLFPAENTLSRIEAARRLAVIQLYRALGGGWSLKASQWLGVSAQLRDESK